MKERIVADLSHLPQHGLQSASLTWWGTLAFMLIEGTGFALAIAIYLYLLSIASAWPIAAPAPGAEPDATASIRAAASSGEVRGAVTMPRGASISGLEYDGRDRFYVGGGKSGRLRVSRKPKR